MKNHCFYLYFACAVLLLSGCDKLQNSRYSEYLSQKYEVPECLENHVYASSTAVIGTAKFFKRGLNLVTQGSGATLELKNMTLGDPLADALPIRYAEVAVYDSNNNVIQCGKTDELGNLKALDAAGSLLIPAKAGPLTVRVFARTNHVLTSGGQSALAHFAVKQDKYTNELYYLTTTANSNGIDDVSVSLTAYARQTDSMAVEGGAFNIQNSILTAYDYMARNTGTEDLSCLSPKFNVYWKIGFNPFQYTNPNANPGALDAGSFYEKESASLFIAGGRLGEISAEVTNHFDDYVIIHEFGHHVEDFCGSLLNPGGSHHLIARVDARLAWHEGWANYFAAQVMTNNMPVINPEFAVKMANVGLPTAWTYFFGSQGFSDSQQNIGNGTGFMFDLKKPGNNPDSWQMSELLGQPFDKVDPTRYPGEGHFREAAITRGLFKLSNTCGTNCIPSSPIPFQTMWKAMSKISGIGDPHFIFKGSSDFMEKVKELVTPGTWASSYRSFNESATAEALHLFSDGNYKVSGSNKWIPYGTYLNFTNSMSACAHAPFDGTFAIQPRPDDPVLTSTNSDTRYSNHYYTIDLANNMAGATEINVTFARSVPWTGTDTEFDLILYANSASKVYFPIDDYTCSATDANGNCTAYQPSRGTNEYMVRADRRSGALLTKKIRDLNLLDPNQRYLLNIKAYTANKSINTTTEYTYTMTDQNGRLLCP